MTDACPTCGSDPCICHYADILQEQYDQSPGEFHDYWGLGEAGNILEGTDPLEQPNPTQGDDD